MEQREKWWDGGMEGWGDGWMGGGEAHGRERGIGGWALCRGQGPRLKLRVVGLSCHPRPLL